MNILDAITTRQSIGNVKPDPIPPALIKLLLHAAVQAPNHYRVRPWRFVVLEGHGLESLGEVFAQAFLRDHPEVSSEVLEKEKQKALRAPLVIVVGVDLPSEPKVLEVENICAASAAVENLLLAAHDQGLAAKWRTGNHAQDPLVKEFLGFTPDQTIIALVYLGYPVSPPAPINRPGYEDRTRWIG